VFTDHKYTAVITECAVDASLKFPCNLKLKTGKQITKITRFSNNSGILEQICFYETSKVHCYVRPEIITVMKITFVWDITQYSLAEMYQCFEKKPENVP